jgi:signal transduction histidine kinase
MSASARELRESLLPLAESIATTSHGLVERAQGADEQVLGDLNKIEKAAQRLIGDVDRVLAPALIEAGLELTEETFGGKVRHDLRTPLNHIIGYCEMLVEDGDILPDATFVPALEGMMASARKLQGVLDRVKTAIG